MPVYYFDRLDHLHFMIKRKATGDVAKISKKMSVSQRTVHEYLNILKGQGAEIKYCRNRKSYYYVYDGDFNFDFIPKATSA